MSRTARFTRVVGAASAIAGIGLLIWWFSIGQNTVQDADDRAESATAVPAGTEQAPTALPTATPLPTPTTVPTPTPTPVPFQQAAPVGALSEVLTTPLPDCQLQGNDEVVAGAVTLSCMEDWASAPVVASAGGRIVHIANEPAVALEDASGTPGSWSWADQAALGPHVVIDHGALDGTNNTQTVYAGLNSIDASISIGTEVAAGQELGTVGGPFPELLYSVWVDDTRNDGARVLANGPPAESQRAVAAALAPLVSSPTDSRCPLVRSAGQLPGATRAYRNGTHRGIDFGCGAADRFGAAIADGTVVYLVNDYVDPTVAQREALLQQAGIAGFTPHWTLVMLYGNVVVIDHGIIPGAGRVVTISAHLEAVDPAIELGGTVTQGQVLGELGNRGTNASAQGIRGAADPSLHLHWELFIDNWYLGAGLDPVTISELITTALCGNAQTAGCPV